MDGGSPDEQPGKWLRGNYTHGYREIDPFAQRHLERDQIPGHPQLIDDRLKIHEPA